MAGFKTHITVSSTLGVAYGAAGCLAFDVPISVSVMATGLCSVSGMLPDLDSDSGVPLRESLAFAAAVVPMMMLHRFRELGWPPETMVMVGGLVYLAIRFGVGRLLSRYTVHRGMFHSLPAALIATEIAFLVYSRSEINLRYYVAAAVFIGFMSHLILDEIWSVGVKRGQVTLKKSFGTAVKLWGDSRWANFSCYGKLFALSFLVLQDPVWMYNSTPPGENLRLIAQKLMDKVRGRASNADLADDPPLSEVPRSRFTDRRVIDNAPPVEYRRPTYRRNDSYGYERDQDDSVDQLSPYTRYRGDQYRPPRYGDGYRYQR